MKALWAQMSVSPEHLPVLMACNQRYLLDLKSCLEEPTGAFVAQVVEMQIDNT